ncbi:flagellar motor switch protein FliM [Desulfacinum infernum DSM 9756]|jgi:flagellar motor switch protein FliM|uniref:Flagellar motor switch protein FliM n=1 Tax=Desulfacinum infernum DSM 9756 TaxID=1121391 RepID=A0A1M4UW72_9BACT|nr:flagellar motor switch protein FliM [Desulfacinum infernum]MBC7357723.1 flagellar motor switch protein FliM [Desulfacinum sp.]MBZ4658173.1 fliM [Desulfacinum sp.]SHE60944.1 flagellar motor switch protein FliM [Desulfacinum infernum DSM 9756]
MEHVLSQDEVDALLKGLDGGEIETETDAAQPDDGQKGIRPYDLTSQDRIIRGRMPTLEIINDRFARVHRITLSGALRKVVDITVTQKEMIKFGDFIRTLPVPTSLHVLKMEPLRGHVLLVVESRLIFNLVDCFFGGTGRSSFKIEGRDFTSIEQRVINKVVRMALKDLEEAWNPVTSIAFRFVRSEVNPQFATIVPPTELVIVVHYELEMDSLMGKIILCLPYSTIEPIRSKLSASYQSDQLEVDFSWTRRFIRRLREVQVSLTVELGRTQIKGQDLLRLEKGDVILLDQDVSHPLLVTVEGVPKYRAEAGIHKGNQAVKIVELITPPRD